MSARQSAAALPDDAPHLLVVDDDLRIRTLLTRYLAQAGYRVTAAANAAEARQRMTALSFDLIVLDPPSLAKREAERAGAVRAYGKLVEDGLDCLSPGGILVACSCSAHVTAEEFFAAVRQAAARSGRRFTELQTTHHAPDHHATFKEADYLKGIYLRF